MKTTNKKLSRIPLFRPLFTVACATAVCGALGTQSLSAATTDAAGYTPTLYVYQNNELIDVKTFKIADLSECQRRASALLQLYLNHSDIEDDMRLVVKCVPSRSNRKLTFPSLTAVLHGGRTAERSNIRRAGQAARGPRFYRLTPARCWRCSPSGERSPLRWPADAGGTGTHLTTSRMSSSMSE